MCRSVSKTSNAIIIDLNRLRLHFSRTILRHNRVANHLQILLLSLLLCCICNFVEYTESGAKEAMVRIVEWQNGTTAWLRTEKCVDAECNV